MKFTLHKLPDGYLITSDEEIKDGDFFITDDGRIEKCAVDWRAREWHKKVIAQEDQIDFSDLSIEYQRKIGWFDVEKLALEAIPFGKEMRWKNIETLELEEVQIHHETDIFKSDSHFNLNRRLSWINGFKKAQKLMSQMISKEQFDDFMNWHTEVAPAFYIKREFEKFILKPKSWTIEIEMELIPQVYGKGDYCRPKFNNNKLKILKIS